MARTDLALPENVPGDLFVDETCIDCDTCRQIEPAVYGRTRRDLSFVRKQPETGAEKVRALMALLSCPTSSIGTHSKPDLAPALARLPEPIAQDIYYCGFTAESSFGATSYLIRRGAGNVLVDSPRAAKPLIRRLEELGGV